MKRILLLVLLLSGLLVGGALAIDIVDNPNCSGQEADFKIDEVDDISLEQLNDDLQYITTIPIEDDETGMTYDMTVVIQYEEEDGVLEARTLSWSLPAGVTYTGTIVVNGGGVANPYNYVNANSDSGLVAPINPNTGEPYAISNVEFCGNIDVTPPTTTPTTTIPTTTPTTTIPTTTPTTTIPTTTPTTTIPTTTPTTTIPTTTPTTTIPTTTPTTTIPTTTPTTTIPTTTPTTTIPTTTPTTTIPTTTPTTTIPTTTPTTTIPTTTPTTTPALPEITDFLKEFTPTRTPTPTSTPTVTTVTPTPTCPPVEPGAPTSTCPPAIAALEDNPTFECLTLANITSENVTFAENDTVTIEVANDTMTFGDVTVSRENGNLVFTLILDDDYYTNETTVNPTFFVCGCDLPYSLEYTFAIDPPVQYYVIAIDDPTDGQQAILTMNGSVCVGSWQ
ncbi:hypothetical protein [Methanoculleus frigidifontis]|uniref:hypothetical protein n=1 Tax=Methanoculleus frigidifontis TaxID=2584085 RepID=UPI0026596E49|nr:hypothetical protein [Methanoculleus sp. FWC-SCC1]